MDIVSILIISGIVILCLLPFIFGAFMKFDKKAEELEGTDPETARALRDARRNIDRGRGIYGP